MARTAEQMPHDRDALRVLVEMVRAAKGPDRDLDLAAYCAATGEAWEWVEPHPSLNAEKLWAKPAGDRAEWAPGVPTIIYTGPTAAAEPFGGMRNVPAYTASLDAALALVAKVLPGWDWEIYWHCKSPSDEATVCLEWPPGQVTARQASVPPTGRAPTAPLAVILALLSALLTQTERETAHAP